MRAEHKSPDPEDQSRFPPRKLLRRKSQPRVSGRLSVDIKKKEGRGWVGMSIDADATAIVEKDGHTYITRAKPKPEEEDESPQKEGRMELTPDEQEELAVQAWVRELKKIQMASEEAQETIYQMMPTETIVRTKEKYFDEKKNAKTILQSIKDSLVKQREMLEEVERELA